MKTIHDLTAFVRQHEEIVGGFTRLAVQVGGHLFDIAALPARRDLYHAELNTLTLKTASYGSSRVNFDALVQYAAHYAPSTVELHVEKFGEPARPILGFALDTRGDEDDIVKERKIVLQTA